MYPNDEDQHLIVRLEEQVYREWATFISAVKPKWLMLKHERPPPFSTPYWQSTPAITMNEMFRDLVLPVLIEGWDGLKRLDLLGVSMEPENEARLRESLPDVSIVVDPRPYLAEILR